MQSVFDNKGKQINWAFRAAYLIALIYFGTICYLFYEQASKETRITNSIRYVSEWFSNMEDDSQRYVKIANQIDQFYNENSDTVFEPLTAEQTSTMSAKKRQLHIAAKKANDRLAVYTRAWEKTAGTMESMGTMPAEYRALQKLFINYSRFFDPDHIYEIKTLDALKDRLRYIKNENETVIAASNGVFWRAQKKIMGDRNKGLADILENFLLFSLGGVCFLAALIFFPVDFLLVRLLAKLRRDNIRIQEAVDKATIADRAKSEFLANISHEIRTPMNGVMGMAELLAKTELDRKQKTFVDIILKSGSSLLTIINDILDFSKIDAGQIELDPAPFRLAEAVEDVAALVSMKVAEKDLEMAVRVAPDLPETVVGDSGRFRQVITNLIGNAVKFTESGQVYVDVSGQKAGDVIKLKFSVKDTGIGISEEKCERIFEKFSQVDESASRKHEGTGLGLAISSSLVRLMGGRMGVESELGVGSTFWFEVELPVHGEDISARPYTVDVIGSRVLIVDGNEVSRAIMSENMSAWKFDSAAASSATEALAVINSMCENDIRLDCVVIDYHLDDINGVELAEMIREDERLRKTPIIILTSVDQTESGQYFSSLDIQGHLVKPVRSSLLRSAMTSAMHDARADCSETISGVAMARMIGDREVGERQIIGVKDEPDGNLGLPNRLKQAEEQAGISQSVGEDFSSEPTQTSEEEAFESIEPGSDTSKGVDVLIAEDNEVNQIVFKQILQNAGYEYVIAENGLQAIEYYEKYEPNVICMDVSMPELNGLDATRKIRELEEANGRKTPIIGVTAHAVKGDEEMCLDAGMDDYLTKPVSPDMLEAKINKWNTSKTQRKIAS